MFYLAPTTAKSSTQVPIPARRRTPYACAPLSEAKFAQLKATCQAQPRPLSLTTVEYLAELARNTCGNDRSLRSTGVYLRCPDSAGDNYQMLNSFVLNTHDLRPTQEEEEAAVMMHRDKLEAERDDLVALTFGQLPLAGLSDKALFVLINRHLPGAAVFVTSASHEKMRSHGLRFVVVRTALATKVKELMHHRLLFTESKMKLLSPDVTGYDGFRQLAQILARRDAHLVAAVQQVRMETNDTQSKLTGGPWPVTVEDCKKPLDSLFAHASSYRPTPPSPL